MLNTIGAHLQHLCLNFRWFCVCPAISDDEMTKMGRDGCRAADLLRFPCVFWELQPGALPLLDPAAHQQRALFLLAQEAAAAGAGGLGVRKPAGEAINYV